MPLTVNTNMPATERDHSLLSPSDYDADAASIRSDQESDSDDDERQLRARNSRELRAHDRLVLMEEDEMDQLVTESRRRQEKGRRGSGLPIPNPMHLFSRRYSDTSRSRSRSPGDAPLNLSSHELISEKEKRASRKARRKAKKERLLQEAKNGEDGELMYEMEEGGMKEGSETGESSEREDSDEIDRRGLLQLAGRRTARTRSLFIHALIAIGFAILVLLAWKLSMGREDKVHPALVSNGTALFAPTTLIISLDGFRADFLQRGLTPRLNAFVKEGISPLYMLPSFPSVTFPNHYTLATGLYPESHGVVGNTFWDPELQAEFYYTDPSRSLDPKWWMGEPFWVTAQRQGLKTAVHMWPGSEAHILETEPVYVDKYNGKELLSRKIDRIMEFLDKPDRERPQIIAAYVPNVDSDGHMYGPNSTEIRATIKNADDMMEQIFKGMEERNLTNIVNVIVVSDHGMATTDVTRLIQLEDLVDRSKIEHTDGWPLVGIRPKNSEDLQSMYNDLAEKAKTNPNIEVYLRDVNMPERYHFTKSDRIAPLWIVPKTGWAIVSMDEMNVVEAKEKGLVYNPRGLHGYDHEHPLMRAIFIARGPAFPHQPGSRVDEFQNIEVYNILCDSVGLTPMPNNGTLRLPLRPVGLHTDPDVTMDTPADPVSSYSITSSSVLFTSAPSLETTKLVQVDPVTTSASVTQSTALVESGAPAKTIGIDHPETKPTDTPTDDNSGDDKSAIDKVGDAAKGFWDWFKGKVEELWDKVRGGNRKGSEEGSS